MQEGNHLPTHLCLPGCCSLREVLGNDGVSYQRGEDVTEGGTDGRALEGGGGDRRNRICEKHTEFENKSITMNHATTLIIINTISQSINQSTLLLLPMREVIGTPDETTTNTNT